MLISYLYVGQRLSIIRICLWGQAPLVVYNVFNYIRIPLPVLSELLSISSRWISHGRFCLFIHDGLHLCFFGNFIPVFESEIAHRTLMCLLLELFAFIVSWSGSCYSSLITHSSNSSIWIILTHGCLNLRTLLNQDLRPFDIFASISVLRDRMIWGIHINSLNGCYCIQRVLLHQTLLWLNEIQVEVRCSTSCAFLTVVIKSHLLIIDNSRQFGWARWTHGILVTICKCYVLLRSCLTMILIIVCFHRFDIVIWIIRGHF